MDINALNLFWRDKIMSDFPTVKKKDIPLSVLLLAAHVAVNYRRLIGIFTGLSSLGAGGVIGLMQYLANVVLALVPVAMLVLVAMFVFQGKAVAKALSALCVLMGVGFLVNLSLARTGISFFSKWVFTNCSPTLGISARRWRSA